MMDVIVGLATPSFTQFADNVKGKVQDVEQPCQALIHSKDIPSETNPRNDFNQFHSNSNNSVLSKRGPPLDDGPPGGGGGGGGGGGPGGGNTFPLEVYHTTTPTPLSLEGITTLEEVVVTQEAEEAEEVPLFLEIRWDHPPPTATYQHLSKRN